MLIVWEASSSESNTAHHEDTDASWKGIGFHINQASEQNKKNEENEVVHTKKVLWPLVTYLLASKVDREMLFCFEFNQA